MTEEKALEIAVLCMDRIDRENYKARADSARYGFQFGVNAKKRHDEIQEAIKVLNERRTVIDA